VTNGKPLLRLDTDELQLQHSAAVADLNRYLREAEKARAGNQLAEMRVATALADQAQAQLDMIRYRLAQAEIHSPFEGVVVEGDLREFLGAPVRQGDPLVKVSRLENLYVEIEVEERDIHEVLNSGRGEIAFVSQPKLKFPVQVVAVEPAAAPKADGNMFIVRCAFDGPIESWWRPGMSGLCKLEVEKRTLFWILTHRTVDFLRMVFWW
jgi:multidrug resistance efflux pump